jgi:hypothetical protein
MSGVTSKERGSALSKPCPPAVHFNRETKGTEVVIVLGADMHKRRAHRRRDHGGEGRSARGQDRGGWRAGFDLVLWWARGLGGDRVWALEDCRHVSGSFERFLIARGERVVRVPTRLMANSRRSSRERGKSDRIDALAVARGRRGLGDGGAAPTRVAGRCTRGLCPFAHSSLFVSLGQSDGG